MKTLTFIQRVRVTPDGKVETKLLYGTQHQDWADRLEAYISQDWEGTKDGHEAGRNKREVLVTKIDAKEHSEACSRVDGRRNGLASRGVEVGQRFSTVTECAAHLGVTVGAVSNALSRAKGEVTQIRGVWISYYDDYQQKNS